MNTNIIAVKFLPLPKVRKKLIAEYLKIVQLPELSDKDSERIIDIWSKTEHDSVLCNWLEAIDYFFSITNLHSEYENTKNEEILYKLSEYLEVKIEKKIVEIKSENKSWGKLLNLKEHILLCPDASGFCIPIVEGRESKTVNQWSKHKCPQCNQYYSDHIMLNKTGGLYE